MNVSSILYLADICSDINQVCGVLGVLEIVAFIFLAIGYCTSYGDEDLQMIDYKKLIA